MASFEITMHVPEARDYEEFKNRFLFRLAQNAEDELRKASPVRHRAMLKAGWHAVPDYAGDRVTVTNSYERDGFNIATLLHEGTGVYGPTGRPITPRSRTLVRGNLGSILRHGPGAHTVTTKSTALAFVAPGGERVMVGSTKGIDPRKIGFPQTVQGALDRAAGMTIREMDGE